VPALVFVLAGQTSVKERFRLFNIKLRPIEGNNAGAERGMVPGVVSSPPGRSPQTAQPVLFLAASNSAADLAQQRSMHELYSAMFQQLTAAIEFGFNLYRQSAGLVDVVVKGPQAFGGRLQGPDLDRLIITAPTVISWFGPKATMRDAVAKGLHQQWSKLAGSVRVPGLPWFPIFAAIPGPTAPPTPNVPTPFMQLTHDAGATAPPVLKAAMRSILKGKFEYSDEFFESLAGGFDSALRVWKRTQMVKGVLGVGGVPNFAPPYVPVGPVVAGNILPGSHINS